MKKLVQINHKIPLFKNYSFWLWLLSPVILGLYFGLKIWWPLEFIQTPDGYKYFIEISKLPLGIVGLALPIVSIYVIHYKSKQSSHLSLTTNIREIMSKSYDTVDSLTSIAITVHRIINHLKKLDDEIKKGNKESVEIKSDLHELYEQWNSVFQNPSHQRALSLQYSKLEKADAYLLGAYTSISQNKIEKVTDISFIKIISELDLVYSNIQIEFVKQKISTIRNIIETKRNYGFTVEIELEELENQNLKKNEYEKQLLTPLYTEQAPNYNHGSTP
jgi:hypothetical protein